MDNLDININIKKDKIEITGLDFTLWDKIKILFTNKNSIWTFNKSKIFYNGKEISNN